MKRISIVFVLLCICLLSSCRVYGTGIPHEKWIMEDNSSVENALMEQVAECLQKQDADGLKKVFSKQALQEADDIDAQIKRLFEFFQGEDISWEEIRLGTSEDSNMGKEKKEYLYGIGYLQIRKNIVFSFTTIRLTHKIRITKAYMPCVL